MRLIVDNFSFNFLPQVNFIQIDGLDLRIWMKRIEHEIRINVLYCYPACQNIAYIFSICRYEKACLNSNFEGLWYNNTVFQLFE